jgi:carbon-monoxide dehydrogenase large subunit
MDYGLLRAADLPNIATVLTETPEASNPLRVKGVGEAAATGSTPAFVNAVLDALAPLGVQHIEAPLTPQRLWHAIAAARSC